MANCFRFVKKLLFTLRLDNASVFSFMRAIMAISSYNNVSTLRQNVVLWRKSRVNTS